MRFCCCAVGFLRRVLPAAALPRARACVPRTYAPLLFLHALRFVHDLPDLYCAPPGYMHAMPALFCWRSYLPSPYHLLLLLRTPGQFTTHRHRLPAYRTACTSAFTVGKCTTPLPAMIYRRRRTARSAHYHCCAWRCTRLPGSRTAPEPACHCLRSPAVLPYAFHVG